MTERALSTRSLPPIEPPFAGDLVAVTDELAALSDERVTVTDELVTVSDDVVGLPDDRAGVADADVEQDPRAELGQLRRAMRTRPVIDMARGILMASFGLSAEDAWDVLVSLSQHTNTKLHLVADELVSAVAGGKIPKPLRQQLAATIARLQATPATPATPAASATPAAPGGPAVSRADEG